MGIHASIDILQLEQDVSFANMDEALESYGWMFKDMTEQEEKNLLTYLHSLVTASSKDGIVLRRPHPPKWAMIWWEKGKIL